jgi:hypothetical protein
MMNAINQELRIELIDSEEAFLAIKDEWDALIDKNINPSFYATFPFVYTAWKHYRTENNSLFILLVRRDAALVGIAPFRIDSMKVRNIRLFRAIRFIAEWGGGDKPAIVTTEKPDLIWDRIFQFLNKEFTQWDGILLTEQPTDSPVLNQKFFNNIWYSARVVPEYTSFYVSITGTWEEYIKTRGKNTYRTWKNSRKKLFDLPERVKFQCIDNPEILPDALDRFIAIEQSGWKKNSDFSVGGSEKQKAFYKELLTHLAYENRVAIYFLISENTDIAGAIVYKYKSIAYIAQITYRPTHSEYSPGVILNVEIIKAMFGTHYKEFDFLGLRGDEKNFLKKNWSTGTRQTITIQIYNRNLRRYLYVMGKNAKTVSLKIMRMVTDYKLSQQAQTEEASP